jgi:hypothetical protein
VPPCRVIDTRSGTGPLAGPALAQGQTRTIPVQASACGVPANAGAYSVNVTVVPAASLGYITVWPTGAPMPVVSTHGRGYRECRHRSDRNWWSYQRLCYQYNRSDYRYQRLLCPRRKRRVVILRAESLPRGRYA